MRHTMMTMTMLAAVTGCAASQGPRAARGPRPPGVEIAAEHLEGTKAARGVFADRYDVWVVGDGGSMDHFEPIAGWNAVASGTTKSLRAVALWGEGAARAGFAVGESGTILRYDAVAKRWTPEESPTKEDLLGVAAVWPVAIAVGAHGTILVREAWDSRRPSAWHAMTAPTGASLHAVYIPPPDFAQSRTVYVVGDAGTVLTAPVEELSLGLGQECTRQYDTRGEYVLMCRTPDGNYVTASRAEERRESTRWTANESSTRADLFAVGGWGPQVFASGAAGTLLHTDAQGGGPWARVPTRTGEALVAISCGEVVLPAPGGRDKRDVVVAVGQRGAVLVRDMDGREIDLGVGSLRAPVGAAIGLMGSPWPDPRPGQLFVIERDGSVIHARPPTTRPGGDG